MLLCALVAVFLVSAGTLAPAQYYPSRPVRLIVAFTPGGTADQTARLIADKMQSTLGETVAVENKPGANGAIAAQYVAQSDPDGYTLFFTTAGAAAIGPAYRRDLNYDPIKDFAAVGKAAINSPVLVVNADMKINSARELAELARDKPGTITSALPAAAPCPISGCSCLNPSPAFNCRRCRTGALRKRLPMCSAVGSTGWSAISRP
jgi:tripartite-type tricarboxylate transporter receptor subunit TctC